MALPSDAATLSGSGDTHIFNILTWFLLVFAGLAVAARFAVKWAVSHTFALDDGFIIVALISDIACGIAVTIPASNDGGQVRQDWTPSAINRQLKAYYAGFIFYVATLHLAKISIIVFVRKLMPLDQYRNLARAFIIFVLLLWLSEWFGVFFQCSPPRVWDPDNNSCIDRVTFWRFVGVLNIVTDLCLISLPIVILSSVRIKTSMKVIVVGCFTARLLDVIASAIQLTFTKNFASADSSRLWTWMLTAQIIQCITIITSCVPYLKPLLESLPMGGYRSDARGRSGMASVDLTHIITESGGRAGSIPRVAPYRIRSTSASNPMKRGRSSDQLGYEVDPGDEGGAARHANDGGIFAYTWPADGGL